MSFNFRLIFFLFFPLIMYSQSQLDNGLEDRDSALNYAYYLNCNGAFEKKIDGKIYFFPCKDEEELKIKKMQMQVRPEVTEVWDPEPKIVTPGNSYGLPPSDAIILFDGTNLDSWIQENGKPKWNLNDGYMTVKPGSGGLFTKQSFGDCQLHIEFRTPSKIKGEGQGRGNSGIYFMQEMGDRRDTGYEVQVLDSYENRTYSNGQASSIYKQHIPLVNASKKPGEWQSYDIFFKAPLYNEKGKLLRKAYVTVIHNGILVQNHVQIQGSTKFIGYPSYKKDNKKEPIMLQDHGDLVSYRNIWIREL